MGRRSNTQHRARSMYANTIKIDFFGQFQFESLTEPVHAVYIEQRNSTRRIVAIASNTGPFPFGLDRTSISGVGGGSKMKSTFRPVFRRCRTFYVLLRVALYFAPSVYTAACCKCCRDRRQLGKRLNVERSSIPAADRPPAAESFRPDGGTWRHGTSRRE